MTTAFALRMDGVDKDFLVRIGVLKSIEGDLVAVVGPIFIPLFPTQESNIYLDDQDRR